MSMIALQNGQRATATKNAHKLYECICHHCSKPVLARVGEFKQPHWAHKTLIDCPSNGMTEWHYNWQAQFGNDEIERSDIFPGNRADVYTKIGDRRCVIEFQHSGIDTATIKQRNEAYGDIAWVVDVRNRVSFNFYSCDAVHVVHWDRPWEVWRNVPCRIYFQYSDEHMLCWYNGVQCHLEENTRRGIEPCVTNLSLIMHRLSGHIIPATAEALKQDLATNHALAMSAFASDNNNQIERSLAATEDKHIERVLDERSPIWASELNAPTFWKKFDRYYTVPEHFSNAGEALVFIYLIPAARLKSWGFWIYADGIYSKRFHNDEELDPLMVAEMLLAQREHDLGITPELIEADMTMRIATVKRTYDGYRATLMGRAS